MAVSRIGAAPGFENMRQCFLRYPGTVVEQSIVVASAWC